MNSKPAATPAATPAPAAPTEAPPAPVPIEAPAPEIPVAEVAAPPRDGIAEASSPRSPEEIAAAEFRDVLRARCRVLLPGGSADGPDGDLALLLDRLSNPEVEVIRQPPLAAQRALGIARNPASSMADLVGIFESDPAMAQGLLATANSVVYRLDKEACESIGHALQRVGARAIEGVILGRLVEGMLCRPGSAYSGILTDVWTHMTRTAPLARDLAPTFMVEPERAFTMGLMHDIGRLVILDQLSDLRAHLRRDVRISPASLHGLLCRLHEPLGGLSILTWELGEGCARSVASHHRSPAPEWSDPLGELLFVAERADHAGRRRQPIDLDRWREEGDLSLDRGDLEEALRDILHLPLMGHRPHADVHAAAAPPEDRLAA